MGVTGERAVMALLQDGLAAQRRGDLAAAETRWREALRLAPANADALQLLGLAAKARGDLSEAERLMRASLKARPDQPHVLSNLANVLRALNRAGEALPLWRRAIAIRPAFADAHANLGAALFAMGDREECERCFAAALKFDPRNITALEGMAALLNARDRFSDALAHIDRGLAHAPRNAQLHKFRGVTLLHLDRHAEAREALERARAMGLDTAQIDQNLGDAQQSLGDFVSAIGSYRRTLERQPLNEAVLADLTRLRWRMGEEEPFADLDAAAKASPQSSAPHRIKGMLLVGADKLADAAEALSEAVARNPQDAAAQTGLGQTLASLKRFPEAIAAHARALELAPGSDTHRHAYAQTLLMAGDPDQAMREAERTETINPHNQLTHALKGLVWRLKGDAREEWLNDYERFVRPVDLPPPEGFRSMEDFNAALEQELIALHRDRQRPIDQTLRGGTQTLGNIFDQDHPLVRRLVPRIEEAIAAYVAGLPEEMRHPLSRGKDKKRRFSGSWSSRLAACGFHTNHVHPMGWISACYYVALPQAVADTDKRQGWIKFGETDFDVGLGGMVRRAVQPASGRVAIFPSYMWHGTIPFDTAETRTTIAFDIVPRD